jgi:hypothetical protein
VGGVIAPPALTREDNMIDNDYAWTSFIRKADTKHLSEEELKQMVSELTMAVASVCFAHGIHN